MNKMSIRKDDLVVVLSGKDSISLTIGLNRPAFAIN